jgi:hypothetical protein
MIDKSRGRSRVAALASSALVAGALAMLPGVAGMSAASAAPVSTGVTCVIPGAGGQPAQNLTLSTLATTLTAPAHVAAGGTFTANVTYSLNLVGAAFGPIDNVAGEVDFVLSVGGVESSVSLPTSTWTTGDKIFTGTGNVTLTAPESVDAADIKVVSAALDANVHVNAGPPGGVMSTLDVPCTPNAGQTTKVATTGTQKSIAYTCVMDPPGDAPPVNLPSTVTVSMDVPDAVTAGESFESTVTATVDMGNVYLGPVSTLAGELDIDFLVGTKETTVSVPITPIPVGGTPMAPPHLLVTGSKKVVIEAPAGAVADAPVAIGDVLGDYKATVGDVQSPTKFPCTVNGGATQELNSTDVEAAPAGLKYTCSYQAWTFPAYVVTTATLPASVKEDAVLNPTLTSTLTWGRFWATSSRSIQASYKDATGVLDTTATPGSGSLTFDSTPVPSTGSMVWTATGSYGAVNTASPGTANLALGNLSLAMMTANQFTGGFAQATMGCVLVPGQDASLGSVVIEDVPDVTPTAAPKVTGAAKVGQKLTASVTYAPADATASYQWLRNGVAISGATAAGYTAVAADLGATLSVRVSGAKTGYETYRSTVTAGKVGAGTQKVTGKVKVTGTAKVGKKLAAVPGKATGATVKYQWLLNGKAIKKATGKTLKVAKTFKGKKISVKVSYVRTGYTAVTQTSSALKIKK